jgi:hypothetical protein
MPRCPEETVSFEAFVQGLLFPQGFLATELAPHFTKVQPQEALLQRLFLLADGF